jgi:coproporphyrinogen III oxidase-like Fe-S oxidoreductase
VHDAAQARAAVQEAAAAFDTFNIDLMYALPGQTCRAASATWTQALAWQPPHLSVYHLTIEPNTAFASRPPAGLPDDDLASDMLDLITSARWRPACSATRSRPLRAPGHRCVHNLNYWQFGDYLGIGAGRARQAVVSRPHRAPGALARACGLHAARLAGPGGVKRAGELTAAELPFEFMLNALRLREGFAVGIGTQFRLKCLAPGPICRR